MYVRIRDFGKNTDQEDVIITISKSASIKELQKAIFEEKNVDISRQRLYYKGKQLVKGHMIIDYNIGLNDVIQLFVSPIENGNSSKTTTSTSKPKKIEKSDVTESTEQKNVKSLYFKLKDLVDYLEPEYGAWFEGIIIGIYKTDQPLKVEISPDNKEPDLIFKVKNVVDQGLLELSFDEIRPRAHYYYNASEVTVGLTVLANYNIDSPAARGYWYEYTVTKISPKFFQGTMFIGANKTEYMDRTVKLINETLRIEKPVLIAERVNAVSDIPLRKTAFTCEKCQDIPSKKCSECGCKTCFSKKNADTIILCDECNAGYHLKCLKPPLTQVPEDSEWYCPECKVDADEIVKAGDKLKYSKKRASAIRGKSDKKRDWGRGMATVSRTSECTIVPKNHFGPIPGVEIGTCWGYRLQASEAGVHRPHVAGIHGRDSEGAYSIALSGGYEDDVDNGDEFLYTGSGGRDLSGNKRVSDQCKDQVLTRMNRALALNCNTPLSEDGGEAADWQGGKPVRVVRSCKMHSTYAPDQGIRYDGIYKVVKYYREKGKSGFFVWRFLFRRDDPLPAPWQDGGQSYDIIWPANYKESKEKENSKKSKKRTIDSSPEASTSLKKPKKEPYVLNEELQNLIANDTMNDKLWVECKDTLDDGHLAFLEKVKETFMCICCQELIYQPITIDCKHNICKICLKRSFDSEIYTCPYCRLDLTKDYKMIVNETLQSALSQLFVGYAADR